MLVWAVPVSYSASPLEVRFEQVRANETVNDTQVKEVLVLDGKAPRHVEQPSQTTKPTAPKPTWTQSMADKLTYLAWSAARSAYDPTVFESGTARLYDFCPGPSVKGDSGGVTDPITGVDVRPSMAKIYIDGGVKHVRIISVRGTETAELNDIKTDVLSAILTTPKFKGKAHGKPSSDCTECGSFGSGFLTQYYKTRQTIDYAAKCDNVPSAPPCDIVIFTGHSLGGILSVAMAMDTLLNQQVPADKLFVITFGAPRGGNSVFKEKLNALLPADHVRLFASAREGATDLVPRFNPPSGARTYEMRKVFVPQSFDWFNSLSFVNKFKRHGMMVYKAALDQHPTFFGREVCKTGLDGKPAAERQTAPKCHRHLYIGKMKALKHDHTFIPQDPAKYPGVKSKTTAPRKIWIFKQSLVPLGTPSCSSKEDCEDTATEDAKKCTKKNPGKNVSWLSSKDPLEETWLHQAVRCVKGTCRCVREYSMRGFNCEDFTADILP